MCNTFSGRLQNLDSINTLANSKSRFIMNKDKAVKELIFGDCANNINQNSVLKGVAIGANPENKNKDDKNDLIPNHINCTSELKIDDTPMNDDANTGNTDFNSNDHNTNVSNSTEVPGEDVDSSST